jgi:hypothetical protein
VLFVEDGQIVTKLDIPLKSISLPPEELLKVFLAKRNEILSGAGQVIARLEDEDAFNSELLAAATNARWPPVRLASAAVVVGTLAALIFLVFRLASRGRFRHDTTAPLLATTAGRHLPDKPLLEQRPQALLQKGNVWEPAVILVRRWFARLGQSEPHTDTPPTFATTGGWWHRWRRVKRLRRLWQLARGHTPTRVKPTELWRLQRELEELHMSLERGEWRIVK